MKVTLSNFKSVMKKKAKKGVYENFGQIELSQLEDQYPEWWGKDKEACEQIKSLRKWAENYIGQ